MPIMRPTKTSSAKWPAEGINPPSTQGLGIFSGDRCTSTKSGLRCPPERSQRKYVFTSSQVREIKVGLACVLQLYTALLIVETTILLKFLDFRTFLTFLRE